MADHMAYNIGISGLLLCRTKLYKEEEGNADNDMYLFHL